MKHIEVVAAIIKNEHNQVFCAKRKDFGELALKWEFPGGKIKPGETNQEALIREIKEELELDITIQDCLNTISHQYNTFHLVMHSYYSTIIEGTLVLNEHTEYRWLQLEDLSTLDWAEADIPIVMELIKRRDKGWK